MNAGLSVGAEALHSRGLFTFADEAVHEIDQFLGQLEPYVPGVEPEAYEQAQELLYLTAAEFALMPAVASPPSEPLVPIREPIPVGAQWATLAIAKTDCVCLNYPWHTDRGQHGQPVPLWDVTAFSADISKLSTFGVLPEAPPTDPSDLHDVVRKLEAAHRASHNPRVQQIAKAGVLQLQGFLWSTKLSLSNLEAGEAVRAAANEFELTAPAYA